MTLPTLHIHNSRKYDHSTLILLLLPVIVFFLTIAVLFFGHSRHDTAIASLENDNEILGEQKFIDR